MAAPRPQRPAPGARRAPAEGGRSEGGARPEFVPAPKKGAHPALLLGLLGLVVVTGGILAWAFITDKDRPDTVVTEKETTNEGEWAEIRKEIREAQRRFDDTMKLRTVDGQHDVFKGKVEDTMDFVGGVLEKVDMMLEPVRLPDGDIPPEYEGYLAETRKLTVMLEDLNKSSGF